MPWIECIPNFSEGRDPLFLVDLEKAVRGVPGALVLDASQDTDHHRAVMTIVAAPSAAAAAAKAAVRLAVERIDLRNHAGVHPRIGAADVLPFVPLEGASMSECVDVARAVGETIGKKLRVPVFFYGAASAIGRSLPEIRRGGLRGLRERMAGDVAFRPDAGPGELHPTAGAVAVGAREILVAYNVQLESATLEQARSIASAIREANGGLAGVRALGLLLEESGLAQVSMNLCDHRRTGLRAVFDRVQDLARELDVYIRDSELIGLVPNDAIDGELARHIRLRGFDPERHIIERRIRVEEGRQP